MNDEMNDWKEKSNLTVPSIFGPSIKVEHVFEKQVRRDRWLFVWKEGKLWGWMCVNIIGMPTQVQKPCFTNMSAAVSAANEWWGSVAWMEYP